MIFGNALDGLRAVAARVMQQDDAAVAALLLDPLEDHLRSRQRVILGVDALHDRQVVEVLGDEERGELGNLVGPRICLVRGSEKRRRASGDRLEEALRGR